MKYKVHVYATVRVPVIVEASNQVEAIEIAQQDVDLEGIFSGLQTGQEDDTVCLACEYADEVTSFLVDEIGDKEYEHTTAYKADGVTIDKSEPEPQPSALKTVFDFYDVMHGFAHTDHVAIRLPDGYYDLRIESNNAYVCLIPNRKLEG